MADQFGTTVRGYAVRSQYDGTLGTRADRAQRYFLQAATRPTLADRYVGAQRRATAREQLSVNPLELSIRRRQRIDGADFDPEGALRPVRAGDSIWERPDGLVTFEPTR
jgi:hypothetical protein